MTTAAILIYVMVGAGVALACSEDYKHDHADEFGWPAAIMSAAIWPLLIAAFATSAFFRAERRAKTEKNGAPQSPHGASLP